MEGTNMTQYRTHFGILLLALALLVAGALAACSSSSDPIVVDDGDAGDGDTTDGDTTDGDDPTDGDSTDGDTSGPCELYEDGCCTSDADCSVGKCYENICIVIPTTEATVWWEDSEYDEEEGEKVGNYRQFFDEGDNPLKPNLDCAADLQDVADAGTVTVKATLVVFGVEAPCTLLEVDVFTMYDDQGAARTEFTEDNRVEHAAVTTDPDENFECHVDILNVPVGRWLVYKTYDAGNVQFKNTYQWNVYIKPEEADIGEYEMEVHAISNTSWELIPVTIGVTNGVQADRGVIAGTLKDCDGRLIKDATIGATVIPTKLGYFNADISDLLPNPALTSSNKDSTFALINQPAYEARLIGLALIGGEVTKISEFKIQVLAQSVSIYSLHGPQPMNYGSFPQPTE